MNLITTNKHKRLFIKHFSKIFIGLGLVLIFTGMLIRNQVVGKRVEVNVQQIEHNIDYCFNQTKNAIEHWFKATDDSLFLQRTWSLDRPEQWTERRISLLLYKNDSLVHWSNYIYDYNFDTNHFHTSNGAIKWHNNKILFKKFLRADKAAIIILNLENEGNGINPEVFPTDKINIYCNHEIVNKANMLNVGDDFYVEPHIEQEVPVSVSIISWLGVIMLLFGIKRFFRVRTKTNNAFTIAFIFLGLIILIGLFFTITDLFIYKNQLSDAIILRFGCVPMSVANFLVIFALIQIFTIYLYRVRNRLAHRYKQLCEFHQHLLILVTIILINLIVIFFHYGMVRVIYNTAINIELYKFTLIDQSTAVFYLICSLFVSSRIFLNAFFKTVFYNRNILTIVLLSVIILTFMILPIQNDISKSGPILVIFHTLFIMLALIEKKNNGLWVFVTMISIFAAYIMLLATVESNVIAKENAKAYAEKLASQTPISKKDSEKFQKLNYFIISDRNIEVNQNNSFDLQLLTGSLDQNIDTTVGGYTHYILNIPQTSTTVVVSRTRITPLDYAAFFAYIYIVLYIVAGALLRIADYRYSSSHKKGKIVLQIRYAVLGVVLFTMTLVIVVITVNTFTNYENSQKKLLNNQMRSLIQSFNQYSKNITDSTDTNTLLSKWFSDNNDLSDKVVIVYDTTGCLLASTLDSEITYGKINTNAYSALKWHNAPYYNHQINYDNKTFNSVYFPIYYDNHLLGYISIIQLDRINNIAFDPRFELLVHVLNILIVVVLIAVVLSMSLYQMLTVPLNKLYMGMGEISALRRIEESDGGDEIAILIRQYNRMIDYLEESYEALARSEREGAWREMARQVAHEIKNPLTPMRLKIQMLQRSKKDGDPTLDQKIDNTLVVLLEQIDLLAKIASEFSDFARMSDPHVEYIDVGKLLTSMNELYTNKEVALEVVPITEKLVINADHSQISRVLINLCQNALQAVAGKPDGRVTISAKHDGNNVVIKITDNGYGISEQFQKKIFQPNFTTKSAGNGLGLAISRQIVLNSGGSISFESKECVGTTFVVTLPYATKASDVISGL